MIDFAFGVTPFGEAPDAIDARPDAVALATELLRMIAEDSLLRGSHRANARRALRMLAEAG